MKRLIASALIVTLFAGCATYRPIVDTRSVNNPQQYENDLRDCQGFAAQRNPGESAVMGAGAGALFGALVSGLLGGNRHQRNDASMAMAISGGTGAAAASAESQINIVRRCMSGRGYQVLD
jgi:outer membrane lipoprotein SlyB